VNAGNAATQSDLLAEPEIMYYGRYAEPAVLVLAACGLAALVDSPRRRRLLLIAFVSLVSTGAFTAVATRGRALGFGPRVPGVWIMPFDRYDEVLVWVVTTLVGGALAALTFACRSRVLVSAVMPLLVAPFTSIAVYNAIEIRDHWKLEPLYETVLDSDLVPGDVVVAADVALARYLTLPVLAQEYHLVPEGWRYLMSDRTSDELIASLPDAQLVVVDGGIDPESLDGLNVLGWAVGLWLIAGPDVAPGPSGLVQWEST
jgi:hypothetical protein